MIGMRAVLLGLCWCALAILPLRAQTPPPLVGPLVAANTPQQDRFLLYDLGASGQKRTLSFGTGWQRLWGFSPDGCRILFTISEGTLPAKLYTARLDGGDRREILHYADLPPERWGAWEPQWSPDGSKIALTMIRAELLRDGTTRRDTHIAWVEPTGSDPRFYSQTGREFSPQWSPDGAWLAYVSYDERAAGDDIFSTAVPTPQPPPGQSGPPLVLLQEADIWLTSADGQTKFRLTNFPTGSVRDPRWSPDGELISFVYAPSPNNDTLWMIAGQPNAIATQLNFNWILVLDSVWLPDGTGLLGALRDFRDLRENRLWHVPLVGNADDSATLYPDETTSGGLPNADYPRFSPDGRWLALRSAYQLMILNVPNRIWDVLDTQAIGSTPPIWSPAGFKGETACESSG